MFRLLIFCLLLIPHPHLVAKDMSREVFLAQVFNNNQSSVIVKTLWLNKSLQKKISTILDHSYPKLRLRYWQHTANKQTVWFLDEVGKERPISFGISIKDKHLDMIRVLTFRESRGGEIAMSSYSDQFAQTSLDAEYSLNQQIDGISGATLSVIAMKKVARLALLLNQEVML